MKTITEAKALAKIVHRGCLRMNGEPYIHHPERVAKRIFEKYGDHELTAIAWLHDVLEENSYYWENIMIGRLFSRRIARAVWALTRKKGEWRVFYFFRVLRCPDARKVKLEDLRDNLADGLCRHWFERRVEFFTISFLEK